MIERLLPGSVVAVEAFGDIEGEAPFPGEESLIAGAVPSRRGEFVTARRCAREALSLLGYPRAALPQGPRREPLWPSGAIGSITHCAGYRAAVVARTGDLASVGIDAEPHAALPAGVLEEVTAGGEPDLLDRLARADPAVAWDRLLFSAKESLYKAWYPLTGRWLGFADACLTIDAPARTFTARLGVDGSRRDGGPALVELRGRFLVARGLIVTATTVPHP